MRVANIRFHSALPYRILETVDYVQYQEHTPVENARLLAEGKVDLAHIPVSELALHESYVGFDFGLASIEKIESILLLADCPVDQLETICLDDGSYSAILLLRVLMKERWRRMPRMIRIYRGDLISSIKERTGALVIGDTAINARRRFSTAIDLSSEWHTHTRLPFVYSVWAGRPGAVSYAEAHALRELFHKCTKARSFIAEDYDDELQIPGADSQAHISSTVNYYLDDHCIQGLNSFFRLAHRHNLIPPAEYTSASYNIINQSAVGINPRRSLDSLLQDSSEGKRIGHEEAIRLYSEAQLADLCLAAELVRKRVSPCRSAELRIVREMSNREDLEELTEEAQVLPSHIRRSAAPILGAAMFSTRSSLEEHLTELSGQFSRGIEISTTLLQQYKMRQPEATVRDSIEKLLQCGVRSVSLQEPVDPAGNRGDFEVWLAAIRRLNWHVSETSVWLPYSHNQSFVDIVRTLEELRVLQDETPGIRDFGLRLFAPAGRRAMEERLRRSTVARLYMDNIRLMSESCSFNDELSVILHLASGASLLSIEIGPVEPIDANRWGDFVSQLAAMGMDIDFSVGEGLTRLH